MSTQKLTILLAITSFLLFSAGCIGEDLTAEQIAEEYKQKMEDLEDFSGTVYTTTYMGEQEMTTISTITQKMPDKMKMVTLQAEQGEGTTLVSDGKTMWAYDANQNTVVITELDSIDGYDASQMDYTETIQNFMDGNEVTFDGMDNVNGRLSYAISIKPNEDTISGFGFDMKAWIDKETWMILKYEFDDEDGNLMMVTEFRDLKVNTGIPDSEFVFDIPEGTDVVTFDSFAEFVAEEMPLEEEQTVSENHVFLPSYLPEGYEFESMTHNNNPKYFEDVRETVSIVYPGESGHLYINENFYDGEPPAIMDIDGEMVDINGHEGILISPDDVGESVSLSWTIGNARISMIGSMGSEEIIKIAESME
ncbi:outer membrane lipoprotein-sorting protein [Methanococcoides methylutens]|uniref:Uncharacterized protein n=1 Tax=Methanococcoides methylutens MM1 TaxID=1434104 RepID=A0A0E3SQC3_METMT|nr:outer membrane lipoprotein-sorting protein [Methanococcoides methylutens]AKB84238.1 hypothetical protein MCMEM_0185 [Methanococcoides methylutens MM1]